MSLVQRMLSTVLFAGHAKKEVSYYIVVNIAGVLLFCYRFPSASETSAVHVILATIGKICHGYDAEVLH